MKKLLTMAVFLAVMFALAACGGGAGEGSGQPDDGGAAPSEPTQSESEDPANGDAPEEAASEDAAPENAAPENAGSANGDGDESAAAEDARSGPSATTIDGEEVSLGGSGDVTALFFMAGW